MSGSVSTGRDAAAAPHCRRRDPARLAAVTSRDAAATLAHVYRRDPARLSNASRDAAAALAHACRRDSARAPERVCPALTWSRLGPDLVPTSAKPPISGAFVAERAGFEPDPPPLTESDGARLSATNPDEKPRSRGVFSFYGPTERDAARQSATGRDTLDLVPIWSELGPKRSRRRGRPGRNGRWASTLRALCLFARAADRLIPCGAAYLPTAVG